MSAPLCDDSLINTEAIQQARQQILPNRQITRLSELYKALGDPTRVKIISALFSGEMCVHDIAALLEMTQSAISHQLRVLRGVGLVTYRKEGKHVIYQLDDEHVRSIFDCGLQHINHQTEF